MQSSEYSDVFVSYRRIDVEFTKKIVQALTDSGKEIWVDWEDIPPGSEQFSDDIKRGIEGANAFIAILSPDYLASVYCMEELNYAAQIGKRLIPIIYRKFDHINVPEVISSINWIYFCEHAGHLNTFEDALPKVLLALDINLKHARNHTRFFLRALEWQNSKSKNSFLLTGDVLNEAKIWLSTGFDLEPLITDLHKEYIEASQSYASRRKKIVFLTASIVFLITSALTVAAFLANQQSSRNLFDALNNQSILLAEKSLEELENGHQQTALKLAVQASQSGNDADIKRDALIAALNYPVQEVQEITFPENWRIQQAIWIHEGQQLLVLIGDHLEIWSPEGELIADLRNNQPLRGMSWNEDLSLIVGWGAGTLVWKDYDKPPVHINEGGLGATLSSDGSLILTWSVNNKASLWNINSNTKIASFPHNQASGEIVWGANWNKNATRVLTWSTDGTARVWTSTGKELFQLSHDFDVMGAVWNSREDLILTWTKGNTAYIWDATTGAKLASLQHDDSVYGSPGRVLDKRRIKGAMWDLDGNNVLTWSTDGTARIWNVNSPENPIALPHKDEVNGAVWAMGDTHVLTWSGDYFENGFAEARLWQANGRNVANMQHEGAILGAVWNGKGSEFITWAERGSAQLWFRDGRLKARLAHQTAVMGAIWNPDNTSIATWSENKLKVWQLITDNVDDEISNSDLLKIASSRTASELTNQERAQNYLPTLEPSLTATLTPTISPIPPTVTRTLAPGEPIHMDIINVPASVGQTVLLVTAEGRTEEILPSGPIIVTNKPVTGHIVSVDANIVVAPTLSIPSAQATQVAVDLVGKIEGPVLVDLSEKDDTVQWHRLEGTYSDFALQTTIAWGPGASEDSCGIKFRGDNSNTYAIRINRDGEVWLTEWQDGTGTGRRHTKNPAIHTSLLETNEFSVVAIQDAFSLYINGNFIAQFIDDSVKDGEVGLVAGTRSGSKETNCGFTNTRIIDLTKNPRTAQVIGSRSINVRVTPGTQVTDTVIAVALPGQYVLIVGQEAEWYQIQLADGRLGWIRQDLVSLR